MTSLRSVVRLAFAPFPPAWDARQVAIILTCRLVVLIAIYIPLFITLFVAVVWAAS